MAFLSTGPRFKIETTTIFSMLDLKNLPQKKLGRLAVNKKLTDPLDTPGLVPVVSAKAKYILAKCIFISLLKSMIITDQVADLSRLGISAM